MFKTTTTLLCFLLAVVILMDPSASTATYPPTSSGSSTETYVYAVCSPAKYSPGSAYETNLNSLFPSLVSSTVLSRYTNLTVPAADLKPEPGVTVYGLFQCQDDLDQTSCSLCVSRAVAQVGTLCPTSYSGYVQMQSCLVRYDNSSFFGVQDKSLVIKKCGQSMGFNDQDALTRAGDVIGSLGSGSGSYRIGGNGDVKGVAQCMKDLSQAQCQDCLADAIGRLRSECGMAQGGYVYLSKCYARFSVSGSHASQTPYPNYGQNPNPSYGQTPNPNYGGEKDDKDDNNAVGKTLAIIIGIITVIILLVVFLTFLGKQCSKLQDDKWCT